MDQRQQHQQVQTPQRVQHEAPQPPLRPRSDRHEEEVTAEHDMATAIAQEYNVAPNNRNIVESNSGQEGE